MILHDGYLDLELIDRDGNVVQRVQMHNLITDTGLTRYGIDELGSIWGDAAVGTGSAVPTVTDGSLSNQVGRVFTTNNSFGTYTRVADGVYQMSQTYEFGYNEANGNLTEWGIYSYWSFNALMVRELFRDGNNNPIVITKTNQEKLRLVYTNRLTVGPVVPTAVSFPYTYINGSGNLVTETRTGQMCWVDPGRAGIGALNCLKYIMSNSSGGITIYALPNTDALTHDMEIFVNDAFKVNHTSSISGFRRAYGIVADTNQANGNIQMIGYRAAHSSTHLGGLVLRLDQPIVKESTHRFTMPELCAIQWARS